MEGEKEEAQTPALRFVFFEGVFGSPRGEVEPEKVEAWGRDGVSVEGMGRGGVEEEE